MQERIVAVGLLTQSDLNLLGPTFQRAWPVEDAPTSFQGLLFAIDEAERKLQEKPQRPTAMKEQGWSAIRSRSRSTVSPVVFFLLCVSRSCFACRSIAERPGSI